MGRFARAPSNRSKRPARRRSGSRPIPRTGISLVDPKQVARSKTETDRIKPVPAVSRSRAAAQERGAMRTAYCFTPDRAFFAPAVRAIASLIEAEPDVEREILLICEPDDVAPGFDKLPAPLRERIQLMTLDFSPFDTALAGKAS